MPAATRSFRLCASAVIAAACVLTPPSAADTFVETFDDPSLPAWGQTITGSHAITASRGKLVMTKPSGQSGGGAYLTLCGKRIVGDFTVTVKATRENVGSAGIAVSFVGPPGGFADVFFFGTSSINAVMCSAGCNSGVAGSNATDVLFKLVRSGTTMIMSYTPEGGDEVIVHSVSAPELASPMQLSLFQLDEVFSNAAYVVTYDDLTIDGTLVDATADLDGDGVVDGADLGLMLGAWGECGIACCEADLNADNQIDGADLGLLLGSWSR